MSNEILDIAARMKELREICEFTPEEMARELNVTPEAYASTRAAPSTSPSACCWPWPTPATSSLPRC